MAKKFFICFLLSSMKIIPINIKNCSANSLNTRAKTGNNTSFQVHDVFDKSFRKPKKFLRTGMLAFALTLALTGCAIPKDDKNTSSNQYVYTVQEGDSLSSIVRQYIGEDASWGEVSAYIDEIAALNGIEDSSVLSLYDEDGNPNILDVSCFKWEDAKKMLDEKIEDGFSGKLSEVAANINCSEKDLAAVIYSESSFKTSNVNSTTSAVGLLQFTPDVLNEMGYSFDEVKSMSALQQMDLVEDYLLSRKSLSLGNENAEIDKATLYTLVFLPGYADRDILVSETDSNQEDVERYERNRALDIDKDGNISKSDLASRVDSKYDEMLSYLGIDN